MSDTNVSASDIRKALASYIAEGHPAQQALQTFLQTESPTPELVVEADKAIIAHLKAHSTPVFGKGARFFLPIPEKFGVDGIGEPLIYSEGERAGQPMKKDWAQAGVKFKNSTDGIEQAVRGNGTSVIIIGGDLTPEKANLLQVRLRELTNGTGFPETLLLHEIKSFLAYAENDLGLNDIWTGSIADVLRATPVDGHAVSPTMGDLRQYSGYFVHKPEKGKDVAAVHVGGGAQFRGDVAGGLQDYSKADGFFVTMGVKDGKSQYRGIAPEAFCRDYVDSADKACDKSILFSVDANTKEVALPARSRIGGRTDNPHIAQFAASAGPAV